MPLYNFKSIKVVPSSQDFVDIVLSKTNRTTPTIIHKGYAIGRIRKFYMRKVKFTQQTFHDRLTQILTDFPLLNDLHPFYSDLINVLYDKDHYKLALGQLSKCRHLIDTLGKDYARLLKYGDSLYRCKQLKRAALGRMCTLMKSQKSTLGYLEEVRQHLSRLPSIYPTTRTIILCGYPNVGESSFMNKVTRAQVDVQPYAFTTKSLFVGHTDHNYLRWQVIDTPGILDHPLEDRNTIEMQAITALAHLRAAVLYVIDISEQCGYSIEQQVSLFKSIKPLFANKPLVVVLNKIDVIAPENLEPSDTALLQELEKDGSTQLVPMSNFNEQGVMKVKQLACEMLLARRVEAKLKSKSASDILSRIHVAQPQRRDDKVRGKTVPDGYEGPLANRPQPEEEEPQSIIINGTLEGPPPDWDPTKYSEDLREQYLLKNDDWKFDPIPEIMDGHNIADFIDPHIDEMLEFLEQEEAERVADVEAQMEEEDGSELLTPEQEAMAEAVKEHKAEIIMKSRAKNINSAKHTRKTLARRESVDKLKSHLYDLGIDPTSVARAVVEDSRARARSRGRSRARSGDNMDLEEPVKLGSKRKRSSSREPSGSEDHRAKIRKTSDKVERAARRRRMRSAHVTESDRKAGPKLLRHLNSGKRGIGKTDRR